MTSKCLKNFDYSEGAFLKLVGGGDWWEIGGSYKKIGGKSGVFEKYKHSQAGVAHSFKYGTKLSIVYAKWHWSI